MDKKKAFNESLSNSLEQWKKSCNAKKAGEFIQHQLGFYTHLSKASVIASQRNVDSNKNRKKGVDKSKPKNVSIEITDNQQS